MDPAFMFAASNTKGLPDNPPKPPPAKKRRYTDTTAYEQPRREPEPLIFHGYDGVEAEAFLRAFRLQIFESGRQDDNPYIVAFIATCFVEEALRWHVSLDDDTKDNWRKLEKAFLQRFPPPVSRTSGYVTRYIPDAPAARPPARCGWLGRISVLLDGSLAFPAYISKNVNHRGIFQITTAVADSLTLAFVPGEAPHSIVVLNGFPYWAKLSATWNLAVPSFSVVVPEWAAVSGMNGTTSSFNSLGPSESSIWAVSPSGAILAHWVDWKGVRHDLFPRINKHSKELFFVGYDGHYIDPNVYSKVTLAFEVD